MPNDGPSTCFFSSDRVYRYVLTHTFSTGALPSKPGAVNFIMLNPSTADEQQLDPTLRRCKSFARSWGYRTFIVTNLFAFRATDPNDMKRAADPVGPENDWHIVHQSKIADEVIVAWGSHGDYRGRAKHVLRLLEDEVWRFNRNIKYLKKTLAGHPCHPLYLPSNSQRIPLWPHV